VVNQPTDVIRWKTVIAETPAGTLIEAEAFCQLEDGLRVAISV
jgi:hypothetical protein